MNLYRPLPQAIRRLLGFAMTAVIVLAGLGQPVTALAAIDIKGAHFDDTYQLGQQSLSLNGAGVRVKVIVDVYAAGLYVPQRARDAAALLEQAGPRSLQIVLLRDLTGEDFADATTKGFARANSPADQTRFRDRLQDIHQLMLGMGKVRKGTVIHIDFQPGSGTSVTLDGKRTGPTIPGDDFFTALLRIWLGNVPVDSGLKESLLGARP